MEHSFEDNASLLGKIALNYMDPVFSRAHEHGLVHEDLGKVSQQDQATRLHELFEKEWEIEIKKPKDKRSLWRALWRTVGYSRVILALSLYAINAGLGYGPILILNQLVRHFDGKQILSDSILWLLVALIFVLPLLASICTAHSNVIMAHIGIQFRNALINMIYRKSLKLSPASRQKQSTGMIVNMFSNDTAQLQRFMYFLNNCALAPAQIIVSLALIYLQVNVATFVGLAFMFFLIPANGFIFGLMTSIRKKKVFVTDARVKLMNEILSGIRVIKYYAWESAFEAKILGIRLKELALLKQLAYVVAVGFSLILMSAPVVQPILIFYTYIKIGNQLGKQI
jgi:ABC-type multidrug transport system fused ATPase/permease subunit